MIVFDKNSEIQEVEDDESISKTAWQFTSIQEIEDLPPSKDPTSKVIQTVDIIGIVHEVGSADELVLKKTNEVKT